MLNVSEYRTHSSELNNLEMKSLHPWDVSIEEAIQIQERLRGHLILENNFSTLKTVGGADVAYLKEKNLLCGAMVVLSYPEMGLIDEATAIGETSFPYVSGLFSFREGPILIKAFQSLKKKPDLLIFDGHGIAHPRGLGLASHMGLWLDLPSIGCAKTPLLGGYSSLNAMRGSVQWIDFDRKKVGAVLRTKSDVKPVFISPGHRIDLTTSIQIILKTCPKFRIPEPLRKAHQIALGVRFDY